MGAQPFDLLLMEGMEAVSSSEELLAGVLLHSAAAWQSLVSSLAAADAQRHLPLVMAVQTLEIL